MKIFWSVWKFSTACVEGVQLALSNKIFGLIFDKFEMQNIVICYLSEKISPSEQIYYENHDALQNSSKLRRVSNTS